MAAQFGTQFARTMAVAWFRDGRWSDFKLEPTGPLPIHPGSHSLHYASNCFEGLKAYGRADGSARIFRLDRHVQRMQVSTELLCLPFPGGEYMTEMVRTVVDACREDIPQSPGSLYLRPAIIGTECNVGAAASASTEACFFVVACPVGEYFSGGLRPLRILIEDERQRTVADFGSAKTGANYALALGRVVKARQEHGADQVLFCPGGDVQETGATNFLLVSDHEVVTKALDRSFLHGVTRLSILEMAESFSYEVTERNLTIQEILEWAEDGEAALSGTAAVLAGVGTLIFHGRDYTVGSGTVGPSTLRLRKALMDVQHGVAEDRFGWLTEA